MQKAPNSSPAAHVEDGVAALAALAPLSIGQRALFHPLLAYPLPLLISAVLQYYYSDRAWSPFQLFSEPPNRWTLFSYLYSVFGFSLGYLAVAGLFRGGPYPAGNLVRRRLDVVVRSVFTVNVVSFVAVQIAMWDANLYQIYSGNLTALEIEEAIVASPPGVHGLALVAGFAALLVWVFCRLTGAANWLAALSLMVACLQFLAKGKAQGLLYVLAAYLLVSKGAFPLVRLVIATTTLAAIFVATRFIRNVDQAYSLSTELLQTIVFGVYFGSPIANTNYIQGHLADFGEPYFLYSHSVPPRLLDKPQTLIDVMPDPTSPAGVVGASLASSGLMAVLIYSCAIGLVAGFVYNRAKYSVAHRAFLPFLFVTNCFAVMYNHYANLTFFWVPLALAHILGAVCIRAEGTGVAPKMAALR